MSATMTKINTFPFIVKTAGSKQKPKNRKPSSIAPEEPTSKVIRVANAGEIPSPERTPSPPPSGAVNILKISPTGGKNKNQPGKVHTGFPKASSKMQCKQRKPIERAITPSKTSDQKHLGPAKAVGSPVEKKNAAKKLNFVHVPLGNAAEVNGAVKVHGNDKNATSGQISRRSSGSSQKSTALSPKSTPVPQTFNALHEEAFPALASTSPKSVTPVTSPKSFASAVGQDVPISRAMTSSGSPKARKASPTTERVVETKEEGFPPLARIPSSEKSPKTSPKSLVGKPVKIISIVQKPAAKVSEMNGNDIQAPKMPKAMRGASESQTTDSPVASPPKEPQSSGVEKNVDETKTSKKTRSAKKKQRKSKQAKAAESATPAQKAVTNDEAPEAPAVDVKEEIRSVDTVPTVTPQILAAPKQPKASVPVPKAPVVRTAITFTKSSSKHGKGQVKKNVVEAPVKKSEPIKVPEPPVAPKVVEWDDIFNLSRPHRRQLLRGDIMDVYVGEKMIFRISKNLLLTVSTEAQRIVQANPAANRIDIDAHTVPVAAIQYILKWLIDTCGPFQAFRMAPRDSFAQNIAIIHAARVLGMEQCVSHILGAYHAYIRDNIPEYEEISAIEKFALGPEDPLLVSVARKLALMRVHGKIPDPEVFEKYLENHERLSMVMEDAEVGVSWENGRGERGDVE